MLFLANKVKEGEVLAKKKYQPEQSYQVGDEVFHPYWADSGKVIEVGETKGGTPYILVEFKRLGVKKLVQQTELKKVETI
jgi:hypothetical protein